MLIHPIYFEVFIEKDFVFCVNPNTVCVHSEALIHEYYAFPYVKFIYIFIGVIVVLQLKCDYVTGLVHY